MKKIALIALTAIGCGVGSVALAADDSNKQDMLAANEIMELFPGNYKAEVSGYDMLITGSTNGDLRGRAFNRQDRGKWWVQDDTLCVSWSNWTDGKPMCGAITRDGDWFTSSNDKGEGMRFQKIQTLASHSLGRKNRLNSFDDRN